jgi:long-chain acyl-CoA synthetase
MIEEFDAGAVLDSIEQYRCTWTINFPYQYDAMLEHQLAEARDLSSLRLCLIGGDTSSIDLQQRVTSAFGAPLYNFWGASEVFGSLTYGLKFGPVARVAEGAQIRLIDETGTDTPRGEIGELAIRGANVFVGYWNDAVASEQSLKDGWYHSGDLMRRGEGNDLWFISRIKDIIIRGGTNISPIEIEEALLASHPAVEAAAVVGKPDELLGQRVFGFVTLSNGTKASVVSAVLENVSKRLANYKVPEDLLVVDALPRNALGKIDRKKLQAMIREHNVEI